MSDSVILVDFGASRIKSVLWSFEKECVTASSEKTSPSPTYGARGEVEFEPEDYWVSFDHSVGELVQKAPQVRDIWICSEMHGFMLVDLASAKPLTRYISWQDQRAVFPSSSGSNSLEDLKAADGSFLEHTGMKLRAGLPAVNLAHMAKLRMLPHKARLVTLPDWLMLRSGEMFPEIHETLAAGTGLYSIKERRWLPELIPSLAADMGNLRFSTVNDLSRPLGEVELRGRSLRLWAGIGDLQAAAHGSDFPSKTPILINLGTGSQVMVSPYRERPGVDLRISARGLLFNAVTHIPGGRALNVFSSLLDDFALAGGGSPFFWELFAELTAEEVLHAKDSIDLNVFQATHRYPRGGSITGIFEGSYNPRKLLSSIARSWLGQYKHVLKTTFSDQSSTVFSLIGGLSRRACFIAPVLENLLEGSCHEVAVRTGEETLDGLLLLAERDRQMRLDNSNQQ